MSISDVLLCANLVVVGGQGDGNEFRNVLAGLLLVPGREYAAVAKRVDRLEAQEQLSRS